MEEVLRVKFMGKMDPTQMMLNFVPLPCILNSGYKTLDTFLLSNKKYVLMNSSRYKKDNGNVIFPWMKTPIPVQLEDFSFEKEMKEKYDSLDTIGKIKYRQEKQSIDEGIATTLVGIETFFKYNIRDEFIFKAFLMSGNKKSYLEKVILQESKRKDETINE